MAAKKSVLVFSTILVISVWVLGSTIQAGAETLRGKSIAITTKDENIKVNDVPGHILGLSISEGLAFFENGEIAKVRSHTIYDSTPGKGSELIIYNIWTFEDGSTVTNKGQRSLVPDKSGIRTAKSTSEFIKGTGRFEGIKGSGSATGKNFLASEGDASRVFSDFTWTYTLPPK
jgi:hypothetical protein